MTDILHRVTIKTTPELLYKALTEQGELSAWWTKAETQAETGGMASFVFGPDDEHKVGMRIIRLIPNKEVVWKCVSGPWIETGEFSFRIEPDERGAVLLFAHRDWSDADDFFMHCNTKWGFFLAVSLKNYLETGMGMPHPADPDI